MTLRWHKGGEFQSEQRRFGRPAARLTLLAGGTLKGGRVGFPARGRDHRGVVAAGDRRGEGGNGIGQDGLREVKIGRRIERSARGAAEHWNQLWRRGN